MGSNNLRYPPAKRPIQIPDPMENGLSNKRSKQSKIPPTITESRQPLPIPEGHVSFRLLCHSSRTGGVIGKSGSIIKQLQQLTGSKIRIEEAPVDSPDRVITIIGPSGMNSVIEDVQVSKAQEGLIKVFERILEVAAETDGISVVSGVVSCRLLAEKKQAGSVIGKGGKVIEKVRKDFGVKIKVLSGKLPVCALPLEEMIEIEGNVLDVKKALIATSRCIQDSQPVDRPRIAASKPVEAVPQERLPVMPSVENLMQRNPMLPSMPSGAASYVPISHHFPIEPSRVPSLDTKSLQKEVIFKILCSNDTVGGVIGKGGAVIKALQAESGASVTIGANVDDCDERLITVTASENPESRYSAAQKAVVLLFSRSFESGSEKGLDPSSAKGFPFAARLTVPSNQVGCLLGKGGAIISEMRKTTGANIKILGRDQLPKCVSENEQVVQISGDFMKVRGALYHVTGKLRDNLFSTALSTPVSRNTASLAEASPYGSLREPFRDPFMDSLRDRLRGPLVEPLRDPLRDPLMEPLREPLGDVFGDPLRDARINPLMRDPSGDALRDSWRDPLTDPLRDTLKEPWRGPTHYNLHSPVGVSVGLNRHSMLTQSMDHLGLSHSIDRPPSPRSWAPQIMAGVNSREIADANGELGSFKGGSELGSVSKSAIVTNTTVEIRVPENVIGSVYGENGNNLHRLRQISGAKVIVHEPRIGSSDRIIVISGTPDETQAAQSLLQAFILTGQS